MASKNIQKGSEEFQMFKDFWELCQKYWDPEGSDEYWENAMKDVDAFHKKYKTPYSKHFSIGLLNALEEIERERRK